MHRHDEKIQALVEQIAKADASDKKRLETELKAREKHLTPLYSSVAEKFADLHDTTGRMKATGVIRAGLEWKESRRYFFWRVRRRVLQDFWVKKIREADTNLDHKTALAVISRWAAEEKGVDFEDDQAMVKWLEEEDLEQKASKCRSLGMWSTIRSCFKNLPQEDQDKIFACVREGQVTADMIKDEQCPLTAAELIKQATAAAGSEDGKTCSIM